MSTLKEAIDDLLDPKLPLQATVDRHFAPGFRQRTNGQWDDRDAFVARIARLRDGLERAQVTVLDEHVDGRRHAQRHVIELMLRDGQRIAQEVYLFAQRDGEGRFTRIEEVTLAV